MLIDMYKLEGYLEYYCCMLLSIIIRLFLVDYLLLNVLFYID